MSAKTAASKLKKSLAALRAPQAAPTQPPRLMHRTFPDFFCWLKTSMNYTPDIFIDVGAAKGFVVIDILDGLLKPSDKALGQFDLAFAPETRILRPHHHW